MRRSPRDSDKPLGPGQDGSLFDDEEREYLRAIEEYRGTLPKRRPLQATEFLLVAKQLGYRRIQAPSEN